MLIDTHAHLDFSEYDQDRDEVIKRAKDNGVEIIINIGSSLEGSRGSLELAAKYENIYAVVGVHPHEAVDAPRDVAQTIKDLAKNKKVVAIGEIGLDYFKNYSLPDKQRDLFKQLALVAKELKLPVVLHSRSADQDTIKIVKEFMPLEAVVHCFSGEEKFLRSCLDLGFFISFTCNITYKKAQNLRDIVRICPLDRMMLETDAPYLSPEGFRGKRNEPGQVKLLAEYVAELRGISFEEVAKITTQNAQKFFRLK